MKLLSGAVTISRNTIGMNRVWQQGRQTTMVRISIHDDTDSTSFTIEGSMTAPVADELKGVWQAAIDREPLKPIVVKLAAVSFVDSECKDLLTRMYVEGVKLLPTGFLMKAIVGQIEAEVVPLKPEPH